MPAVGEVLSDRYRIDGILGAGGMASVYRATDLRLDRQVAVKVLLPNLATDPSLADRFDREARMLAAIAHPNVAAIYDVDPGDPLTGREPFFVMELCDGGSLADRLDRTGPLDPHEAAVTIGAVADGLGELHRQGLIHRDVKPGNILYAGGRPKLADFGLARTGSSGGMPTLTLPGTTIGTPAYLAPELVAGGRPTISSDVYALGATAFHCLTGRPPRSAESLPDLVATLSAPAPKVSDVSPALGTVFDAPIAAALAADPADRPTLAYFTASVAGAAEGRPVGPMPAASGEQLRETVAAPPSAVTQPPMDDTQVVPTVTGARQLETPRARTRPPRRASRERTGIGATTVVALAAVVLAIAALLVLLPGLVVAPSVSPSPFVSPSPIPSPSASPTAAASPSPTPDPAGPALEALTAVDQAIEAARGGPDGLKGSDANELHNLADDVRQALLEADWSKAREAAGHLAERADKDAKGLSESRATALKDSIERLREAIPTT